MQRSERAVADCESTLEALMAWAHASEDVSFRGLVQCLSEHGFSILEAHTVIRHALDRRLLIAKVPVGQIDDHTRLIPAGLKRGTTSKRELPVSLGSPDFETVSETGNKTYGWLLGVQTSQDRPIPTLISHRERDRELAKSFGRSHIPFGPLRSGERLVLKCRFDGNDVLRGHAVEVLRMP